MGSLDDYALGNPSEGHHLHLRDCEDCRRYAASYLQVIHLVHRLSEAGSLDSRARMEDGLIVSLLERARRRAL